jgi:hypothetical protein
MQLVLLQLSIDYWFLKPSLSKRNLYCYNMANRQQQSGAYLTSAHLSWLASTNNAKLVAINGSGAGQDLDANPRLTHFLKLRRNKHNIEGHRRRVRHDVGLYKLNSVETHGGCTSWIQRSAVRILAGAISKTHSA